MNTTKVETPSFIEMIGLGHMLAKRCDLCRSNTREKRPLKKDDGQTIYVCEDCLERN